ncbi:MAG TPA: hypothetical protein VF637_18645 [Sphingomicrobium sp.]|jgi:hypothetical protein
MSSHSFDRNWELAQGTDLPKRQTDPALGDLAKGLYQARRRRDKAFSVSGLFEDPAWDMLLALYVDEARGYNTGVTSACIAGNVAPTTGYVG